jgi:hypothetical protein
MHRATEDLRRSGILDRIVKVGASACRPSSSTITTAAGSTSEELLAGGPMVLSVLPRGLVTLLPA